MILKFCNLQTQSKVLLPIDLDEPLPYEQIPHRLFLNLLLAMQIESTRDFRHIYIDTLSFHTHWVGSFLLQNWITKLWKKKKSKYWSVVTLFIIEQSQITGSLRA